MTDVTDADFQTAVIDRSNTVPVVVDLWAPWCGPCKQLGPILEKVVGATDGAVELVKVNVDESPGVSQAFRVQSIPAVYALKDGAVVDGFVGAQGEGAVAEFISRLVPTEEQSEVETLISAGDEASLRAALEIEPDNPQAIVALGEILAVSAPDEVEALLARIPESPETRRVAALARTGGAESVGDVTAKLDALLGSVKFDEVARQEYIDLLELLGGDDPRTADYRKKLTSALF